MIKQDGFLWHPIELATVFDPQIRLDHTGGGVWGAVNALGGLCGHADLCGLLGCDRYFKLVAAGHPACGIDYYSLNLTADGAGKDDPVRPFLAQILKSGYLAGGPHAADRQSAPGALEHWCGRYGKMCCHRTLVELQSSEP